MIFIADKSVKNNHRPTFFTKKFLFGISSALAYQLHVRDTEQNVDQFTTLALRFDTSIQEIKIDSGATICYSSVLYVVLCS